MSLPSRYQAYVAYINSPEWRAVRQRYFQSRLYKGRCAGCGATGVTLDVHHRTYRRLGHEWLGDLIAVCRRCHDTIHNMQRAETEKKVSVRSATSQIIRAHRNKDRDRKRTHARKLLRKYQPP